MLTAIDSSADSCQQFCSQLSAVLLSIVSMLLLAISVVMSRVCMDVVKLFVFHALGWMDVGDEITWSNQYKDADKERCDVEGNDPQPVDLNRNSVHIISCRIEFYKSCKLLNHYQSNANDVADEQATPNNEGGKP